MHRLADISPISIVEESNGKAHVAFFLRLLAEPFDSGSKVFLGFIQGNHHKFVATGAVDVAIAEGFLQNLGSAFQKIVASVMPFDIVHRL